MVAPTLDNSQRQQAARKSLEVRKRRAMVKLSLAAGAKLGLFWTAEVVQGMKVADLLESMPRIGPVRARSILERAGIPVKNTVRACGPRQRDRLFQIVQ